MYATIYRQTFCETIYVRVCGSFHEWEVELETNGTMENGRPEIDGIEVKGARIGEAYFEGRELHWDFSTVVDSPRILDWLDSWLNHKFWHDDLERGLLEKLTMDSIRG